MLELVVLMKIERRDHGTWGFANDLVLWVDG